MGTKPSMGPGVESETRFRVDCDKCGIIKFEGLGDSLFKDYAVALYYAGLHDGAHHSDADYQVSAPEPEVVQHN